MIRRNHAFLASLALSAMLLTVPARAELQRADVEGIVNEYLSAHPEAVERIVKEYLVKNPEILRDALADMIRKRLPAAAAAPRPATPNADQSAAIRSNASQLFDSAHQGTLGNSQGDVTLVEFFDYNCGYCKRALSDTLTLLRDDPNLRIVLKEFPILGPGSAEAARVSIAVRVQDSGQKYLEFHRRLLGAAGPVDKAAALAVARDIGFDVERIERDLASDEIRQTLEESMNLARALGIRGTPGYVVGTATIAGAVGAAALKDRIAAVRTKPRE